MAAGQTRPPSTVFQFRVSLREITPEVWRRIQVPSTYSFWDLHVAIQDAMGWLDYHLHEFTVRDPKSGAEVFIGIPSDADFEYDHEVLPGWKKKIDRFFSPENPYARYTYDFGDDWWHDVLLESVLPKTKGQRYPICIDGARRCPPEDCGGTPGYEYFLEAVTDPTHEEHEEYLEWVGGPYDPSDFKPEMVIFDNPKERWKLAFEGDQ